MNTPEKYVASNDFQRTNINDLIEEFRDEMKAMHGRVMDIGCGPGDIARDLILPHLPDDAVIVGTDISADMMKYAKENNENRERLSFRLLNIETTELPVDFIENYDNAVSFFCLHWCMEMKIVSNNMYKLLRPGGKVLILFLSQHPVFEIYLKLRNNQKYSVYIQDAPSYISPLYGLPNPEESLTEDLKEAGFEVMHCTERWRTFTYKNLECFLDLVMSVSPFMMKMPDHLKQEYRNDMKEEIIKSYFISENHGHSSESSVVDKYAIAVAYIKKPRK